jgi:uncharacterized protein (DUF697 family)
VIWFELDSGKAAPVRPEREDDVAEKWDVLRELRELRERFREQGSKEFVSGGWFASLIGWILEAHAKNVSAEYIRRKYPGAGPINHSKKAIQLASRNASLVGGASAAAVTALELSIPSTWGLDAPLAIPAIGASIMADVALTTRIQLACTYDLSVIHGAPLLTDDADDCYFIFLAALGARAWGAAGDVAKAVGPKIIAYNVRKLLRAGLRKALVDVLTKIGGVSISRKLTERAVMEVAVPGIGIPIAAGANYLFTRSMLRIADAHMRRRGAIVQPLLRLYRENPDLSQLAAVKGLIVVLEAPRRDGWEEGQLQALRHTQSVLAIGDDGLAKLDDWFERRPEHVIADLAPLKSGSGQALVDYVATAAAMGSSEHDDASEAAIAPIAAHLSVPFDRRRLADIRHRLG